MESCSKLGCPNGADACLRLKQNFQLKTGTTNELKIPKDGSPFSADAVEALLVVSAAALLSTF